MKAKTYKNSMVWSVHPIDLKSTVLVASVEQNILKFEISILEPTLERLTAQRSLESATLVDLYM